MNYPPLDTMTDSALIYAPPLAAIAVGTTFEYPSATTGFEWPAGVQGDMMIIFMSRNGTSAGCTIDGKITESDATNGTYTDATYEDGTTVISMTQVADTSNLTAIRTFRIPMSHGRKKFIRLSITTGAGTNGPTIAACVVSGGRPQQT